MIDSGHVMLDHRVVLGIPDQNVFGGGPPLISRMSGFLADVFENDGAIGRSLSSSVGRCGNPENTSNNLKILDSL